MPVSMEMKRLLSTMVSKGASDLLCTVGLPPTLRLQGSVRGCGSRSPLSPGGRRL
jgi:Tfp pilus assembly ATPase PilU